MKETSSDKQVFEVVIVEQIRGVSVERGGVVAVAIGGAGSLELGDQGGVQGGIRRAGLLEVGQPVAEHCALC